MNKGTYGFGLPPNFATRVAPPKWNNFQPYTAPGTYNFTVPQNVYQVYGVAVGGGGDGTSIYTTVPSSTNMVFPVVSQNILKGMKVAALASNQYDTQLCAFNNNLYYYGNSVIYVTSNLGTNTGTSVLSLPSVTSAFIFAKDGLMVVIPRSASGNAIRYTNNGVSWSTSTNTFDTSVNNYAWGATNANLIITSTASNSVQYSTNSAVSFTTVATSGIGATGVRGIAYGAGVFVAVGTSTSANQGISSSPTGATWTARTSVIGAGSVFNCVRFLNNQFIAVSNGGAINTSPDGTTWTNRTSGTGLALNDITYDSTIGLYLISGTNGASNQYLTSPDGITWTLRSLGVSLVGNLGTALWCNSLNGCFVINCNQTNATGEPIAATSTDGINWRLAAEHISNDTAYSYTNPVITGGKMYFINISLDDAIFIGCNYTMPGGGGGGFAGGIVDVVPGQTLTVTVGAAAGSSSIGTNITATGGSSSGAVGTGVVTPTLRGVVTASGGIGGVGTLTNTTFNNTAWKVGGGGGGAAGWNGIAGGAGGATTSTGAGGGGGILLGNGGSSTSSGAGGGGGAGFAGASTSTSGGVGGGGTNSASIGTAGGNGFSCTGGATTGLNGGNPTTTVSLSYVLSLLSGAFEGAGGAGGTTNGAGGNGSGIGGGGGGGGISGGVPFAGGIGSIGGGGGGSPPSTGGQVGVGAGSSVYFGGGGGQGSISTQATVFLTGWGGSSGAGGGGGAHNAGMGNPPTVASLVPSGGAAVGANVPGSKVNGAAGAGGVGYVALLWTEGY